MEHVKDAVTKRKDITGTLTEVQILATLLNANAGISKYNIKMIVTKRPFIIFGKPDIGIQEKNAVMDVLDSGWLSTGPVTKKFEEEFRKAIRTKHAIAVSSCTDGMIIALMAAGVGYGDEVITSPMTYPATVNAIMAVGARPVFVDVNKDGLIEPLTVQYAITERTKAVIPVHYTGAKCDADLIRLVVNKRGITVIEDAAHSFGGDYGILGDMACYSFYPTKNITSGEGGMVVTNSGYLAEKLRTISMQGVNNNAYKRYSESRIKQYEYVTPGRKANMSDIHAAIGLTQLRRWPEIRVKRDAIWRLYEKAFGEKPTPHSHHLFTIEHPKRDKLRDFLHKNGVGTGIHFKVIHKQFAFQFNIKQQGSFPVAENIGRKTLSLPISSTMTSDDVSYVVDLVRNFKGD